MEMTRETVARAMVMLIAKGYGTILTLPGMKPFAPCILILCLLYSIAKSFSLHMEDMRHIKIIAIRDNIFWNTPTNFMNLLIMIYIFVSFSQSLAHLEKRNLDLKALYLKKIVVIYALTCLVEFFISFIEIGFRLVDPDLDFSYYFIWFWDKHPLLSFTVMLISYSIIL